MVCPPPNESETLLNLTASAKEGYSFLPRQTEHLAHWRLGGIVFAHSTGLEEKKCLKIKKLSW
jgi:hypothetical protein